MSAEVGPWSRLLEEHRRNAERLDLGRPEPPSWWGLPLGFVTPWVLFAAAVAWRAPEMMQSVGLGFVLLAPLGLVCLFVQRLQSLALGLLLGTGAVLFVANAFYR